MPSDAHFLPLLYVLGTTRSDDGLRLRSDEIVGSSISMLGVVAGTRRRLSRTSGVGL